MDVISFETSPFSRNLQESLTMKWAVQLRLTIFIMALIMVYQMKERTMLAIPLETDIQLKDTDKTFILLKHSFRYILVHVRLNI